MIITCPSCSKRYLVEDTAIETNGRHVQCVTCEHVWFFKPLSDIKDLNQGQLDLIGVQSTATGSGIFHWGLFFISLIIVVIVTGSFFARDTLMTSWPQTTSFFKAIGFGTSPSKTELKIEGLRSMMDIQGKNRTLLLTGTITNEGDKIQEIKNLKIIVKGDCAGASWFERLINKYFYQGTPDQCRLDHWTYEPSERKIYPGEQVAFETSSMGLIQGAKSIQVQF